MSIECAVCERDARGGHAENCPYYVVVDQVTKYADPDWVVIPGASLTAQSGPLHTEQELDSLKLSWLRDPNWDLEESEGFEAYREQLKKFADEQHAQWQRNATIHEQGYQQGRQEADPNYYRKQMVEQLERLNKNLEYLSELYGNSGRR